MTVGRVGALVLAACLAVCLLPAAAKAATAADPLRTLGGDSPLCATASTASRRA